MGRLSRVLTVSNNHLIEVVGRGSETQLQLNLN